MPDAERRREALRRAMADAGIDLLLAVHDGGHFIEKPNLVTVLSGFKSLGEAALAVDRTGDAKLFVAPAWDTERAPCAADMQIIGADDVLSAVIVCMNDAGIPAARVGVAGLGAMPWRYESGVTGALGGAPQPVDALVLHCARCKTPAEIAHAREATRIAELGYQRLLDLARPGMREDDLATELKWHMKTCGAEDNFLMLCSGPHQRAVQPPSGRRIEPGDLVLTELTPSYRGQLSQICRTLVVGKASVTLKEQYAMVVEAMARGIEAATPGARMADVCGAINAVLECAGYGEYCHPPHIRRRGHGLGFGSTQPGDVSPSNHTPLEPGMFFVIHPNQYLPETGYLMCGEPVLIGPRSAEPLTARRAALAEIAA